MINYSDFPADSWNKTVDGPEVRKIVREEVRAEGERIVKSLVKAINPQDAVEVVRCKDCKYLDIINKAPVYACCSKHNHTFPLFEEDTREHFCSWGERREENATDRCR